MSVYEVLDLTENISFFKIFNNFSYTKIARFCYHIRQGRVIIKLVMDCGELSTFHQNVFYCDRHSHTLVGLQDVL